MKKRGKAIGNSLMTITKELETSGRRFNPVEIGQIINILADHFRLPQDKIIKKYLPWLGLPPSPHFLHLYRSLTRLPLIIKKALVQDLILPELGVELARLRPKQQKMIIGIIRDYRLTATNSRQFLEYLTQISRRDKQSIQSLLADYLQRLRKVELPPRQKGEWLLKTIRRDRFPNLARIEDEFAQLLCRLKLPPEITLRPADNWEGTFQLTARFNKKEQLKELVKKIESVADSQDLSDFLDSL